MHDAHYWNNSSIVYLRRVFFNLFEIVQMTVIQLSLKLLLDLGRVIRIESGLV